MKAFNYRSETDTRDSSGLLVENHAGGRVGGDNLFARFDRSVSDAVALVASGDGALGAGDAFASAPKLDKCDLAACFQSDVEHGAVNGHRIVFSVETLEAERIYDEETLSSHLSRKLEGRGFPD